MISFFITLYFFLLLFSYSFFLSFILLTYCLCHFFFLSFFNSFFILYYFVFLSFFLSFFLFLPFHQSSKSAFLPKNFLFNFLQSNLNSIFCYFLTLFLIMLKTFFAQTTCLVDKPPTKSCSFSMPHEMCSISIFKTIPITVGWRNVDVCGGGGGEGGT